MYGCGVGVLVSTFNSTSTSVLWLYCVVRVRFCALSCLPPSVSALSPGACGSSGAARCTPLPSAYRADAVRTNQGTWRCSGCCGVVVSSHSFSPARAGSVHGSCSEEVTSNGRGANAAGIVPSVHVKRYSACTDCEMLLADSSGDEGGRPQGGHLSSSRLLPQENQLHPAHCADTA